MKNDAYLAERAMRVAAEHHAGQFRKGSQIPYITHPASVVIALVSHGITAEEILAAAWLHDVLEDTDCTKEKLTEIFPDPVVSWISDLSEVKLDAKGNKRPWIDRKRDHLEVIRNAAWQSRAIALADKIHNAESILLDIAKGHNPWQKFNAEPARVLWYYSEMQEAAYQNEEQLASLANRFATQIEQLKTAAESTE